VQLPADLADWITELVRDETQMLEAGSAIGRDPYDDDLGGAEGWWG